MSIINDALKKVQQGLAAKPDASTADVEILNQDSTQNTDSKSSVKNKIKSLFAMIIAIAITIGAILYIFQQFGTSIPRVEKLARSAFYKLIHKKEIPEFKTKSPEELKPLAKITINTTPGPVSSTVAPPAPVTLNIHGIMSNATGNLVLINDSVYQEGDEVDGAKIIKINLDSITVNNNGTEQIIPVRN